MSMGLVPNCVPAQAFVMFNMLCFHLPHYLAHLARLCCLDSWVERKQPWKTRKQGGETSLRDKGTRRETRLKNKIKHSSWNHCAMRRTSVSIVVFQMVFSGECIGAMCATTNRTSYFYKIWCSVVPTTSLAKFSYHGWKHWNQGVWRQTCDFPGVLRLSLWWTIVIWIQIWWPSL